MELLGLLGQVGGEDRDGGSITQAEIRKSAAELGWGLLSLGSSGGRDVAWQMCSVGMLGEGRGHRLAPAPAPASWAEWGEMGHPTGTLVDRLSTSAHQRACAPECPDCVSPPLRPPVHSLLSRPEARRSPALAFHSAAVWAPTDHTASLGLRFCPAGPRDGQGPSQACRVPGEEGHCFPSQDSRLFSDVGNGARGP